MTAPESPAAERAELPEEPDVVRKAREQTQSGGVLSFIFRHIDALKSIIAQKDAEIAGYRAQAESFHEEYRRKCDVETKVLHVRVEKLTAALKAINRNVEGKPDDVSQRIYKHCQVALKEPTK